MVDFKFDSLNEYYEELKADGDYGLSTLYIGIDVMNTCSKIVQETPGGDTVTLFHMLVDASANCMNGAAQLTKLMDEEQLKAVEAEIADAKTELEN